jgi:hypothetical protein
MVVFHVHTQVTAAGDRLSVYSGHDKDHMQLSGILWCNREASAEISRLLDPDGATTQLDVTGSSRPEGVADVVELRGDPE